MAQRSIVYNDKTYDISYDIVNPKGEKILLVLHGWGSNKEIMQQAFSRSLFEYKHIYVDMPGFGKSPNSTVLTTVDYAHIMQLFCDTLELKVDAIMGHSFGGKVAALMNPPYMILLSCAGIPVPKRWSVRVKIKIFKFFKLLGLGNLYYLFATKDAQGMSKVMYETLKNVVNDDFRPIFANFHQKCDIFWGEEDTATPLTSGKTIHELIKSSRFFSYTGDHFFFLAHNEAIAKEIH